jgi:hypothetical protein
MTDNNRAAASRENGRKSRGPRTSAGRARASINAYRHGICTISIGNPEFAEQIEAIASRLCTDDPTPQMRECALTIAENEFILRCISAEQIFLIERLRRAGTRPARKPDNSLALGKARFGRSKLAYSELGKIILDIDRKNLMDIHREIGKLAQRPRPEGHNVQKTKAAIATFTI